MLGRVVRRGRFPVVVSRVLALLVVSLAAAVVFAGPAAAVDPQARTPALQFLGQAIIPTGATFAGTEIGGLSSITYDPNRNVYYVLSDDRSQINPARFYTFQVGLDGSFDASDLHVDGVTILQAPGGSPYPPLSLDPEGLALTKDGWFFFTGTENALFQDGPAATVSNGSPSRLLRYDLQIGRLDREYLYVTDPIAVPPVPATAFAVNGLVELLPLNNEFMLAMERSFSVGIPGTGNEIKLYRVALPGADDVKSLDSLAGSLGSIRPAQKTLLLDLGSLGIPLDNVEGMTFGPDLPDGRRSLVMVSDNNFAASQFTQFLLFAVSPG